MIHPTAVIDPRAELAPDVRVGPYSIIGPEVTIGAGAEIGAHVVLEGRVRVGARGRVGHGAIIGGMPQDLKFREGTPVGVSLGDDSVVREYVTIHRATHEGHDTTVGRHCLIMASSHVAHDCVNALATYQHLRARYRSALETLRNGLRIQTAACTGLGVAVSGNRFARFRCPVTSMPLEIPTVELDFEDRVLPQADEGQPRVEGPFQALLDIRVTGRSAIAYRQLR